MDRLTLKDIDNDEITFKAIEGDTFYVDINDELVLLDVNDGVFRLMRFLEDNYSERYQNWLMHLADQRANSQGD